MKLRAAPEHHDAWKSNKRAPKIDDVGALVEVLSAPGLAERDLVECVARDGTTDWLEDFAEDELEPAE